MPPLLSCGRTGHWSNLAGCCTLLDHLSNVGTGRSRRSTRGGWTKCHPSGQTWPRRSAGACDGTFRTVCWHAPSHATCGKAGPPSDSPRSGPLSSPSDSPRSGPLSSRTARPPRDRPRAGSRGPEGVPPDLPLGGRRWCDGGEREGEGERERERGWGRGRGGPEDLQAGPVKSTAADETEAIHQLPVQPGISAHEIPVKPAGRRSARRGT